MNRILIVDDDPILGRSLKKALANFGYSVENCDRGFAALDELQEGNLDLVLLDNKLPDISGLEVIRRLKNSHSKIPVVMVTAYGTEETAIEAMKYGAYDYVLKPFDLDELKTIIDKGIETYRLMNERSSFDNLHMELISDRMIGSSRKMQCIYKIIGQVASTDISVIISGESGTGKELVARMIHKHSPRKDMLLLAVNCAAIPETLLESELFGHEKGSFSGADKRMIGKFEQCHKGTIFLDEIGDMPISTQAKILRVLQNGEFQRIGGQETIRVDVRVIAATNKSLEKLILDGGFREDLYYRLQAVTVNLPPIRERGEDIRELAEYIFTRFSQKLGSRVKVMDPSVIDKLQKHHWPGNVRELANTIQRGIILSKGDVLMAEHIIFGNRELEVPSTTKCALPDKSFKDALTGFIKKEIGSSKEHLYDHVMGNVERILLHVVLEEVSENQVHAANLLGICRNTLRERMKRYGIMSFK